MAEALFSADDFRAAREAEERLRKELEEEIQAPLGKKAQGSKPHISEAPLAKNPAETVPGIIEACGLPWDDACLSPEKAATEKKSGRFAPTLSEQQLRRPINTSAIGRAEAFTEKIVEFQKGFDSIRKD